MYTLHASRTKPFCIISGKVLPQQCVSRLATIASVTRHPVDIRPIVEHYAIISNAGLTNPHAYRGPMCTVIYTRLFLQDAFVVPVAVQCWHGLRPICTTDDIIEIDAKPCRRPTQKSVARTGQAHPAAGVWPAISEDFARSHFQFVDQLLIALCLSRKCVVVAT